MPTTGNLTVRIDAWSDTYGACEPQTIIIPRGDGLVGLTPWGKGYDQITLATSVWTGGWSGEGDIPSGDWQVGSCMPLSTKPIKITIATSGDSGSATKTINIDACKHLVPPNTPAQKQTIRISNAKFVITRGEIQFWSTSRGPGTTKYTVTATWGSARSVLRRTVRWIPEVIIWQGTDAFVNTCINDSYNILSKNGQLFCKKVGYQDW